MQRDLTLPDEDCCPPFAILPPFSVLLFASVSLCCIFILLTLFILVPLFECMLWYNHLHFQFLQTAINRGDYFSILSKRLGFKYGKNDTRVVEALFENGNVHQAIKWAQELEKMHVGKTPSESHPSTKVHKLVERLLIYFNMKKPI